MWALCKFLNNSHHDPPDGSVSEGCCGTSRIRIWCNAPTVTVDNDIMLLYDPPLLYPDVRNYPFVHVRISDKVALSP